MNGVTCHRLPAVLKEPALTDLNVLHHHVLQWGDTSWRTVHCAKTLLFLQQSGIFAFGDLPAIASGYLLLHRYPQILQALVGGKGIF